MRADSREDEIEKLVEYLEQVQAADNYVDYERMISNFKKLLYITKRHAEDQERHDYFKKIILNIMIERGGYFKNVSDYSSTEAIKIFKAILMIDNRIPIAHYRLGHLCYRDKKYIESLSHFTEALKILNDTPRDQIKRGYSLDDLQINHANFFIAINGLCLVREKKDYLRDHDGIYRQLSDELIESLEIDYQKTEYVQYNLKGYKKFISGEELDQLLKHDDLIILYRVYDEIFIQFGGDKRYAISLIYFNFIKQLLSSKKHNPLMTNQLVSPDSLSINSDRLFTNEAFRKRIQRLRTGLSDNEIPMEIGIGRIHMKDQGYYAEPKFNYYIIEREETFIESFF